MDFDKIIERLLKDEALSFNESFLIASTCSIYLDDKNSENDGRRIIINILEQLKKIPLETYEIWTDLIEIAGFYPYLEKEKKHLKLTSIPARVRKAYHISNNLEGMYFQEEQKYLLDLLSKDKNVVVSAPTSFGKSLLIEEIVASKKYKNIVIIQPTLALLDETRRKLLKYKDSYKIIVRTSQEPSPDKGNLFLLTAERVYEYLEFPHIDFLIIDEFYKLSGKRKDPRADVLNSSFYKLYNKFKCRFYLLGPNIDGISDGFEKQYNAIFFKTDYSLVDCVVKDIFNSKGIPYIGKAKREKLFELLISKLDEQTIIFCASPDGALKLSIEFMLFLEHKNMKFNEVDVPLTEWLYENISKEWGYIPLLKNGIGVHVGSLPKHITSSVIDYFNSGKLKFLFCTTTIIEGVNTSAKNMVFFDNKKGKNIKIDYFDYANIKGRSGRLMIHYTGNMYNFNLVPEKTNLVIDIPFFDQKSITAEVLINLKKEDVIDKETDTYKFLESLSIQERELYAKNSMPIHGQKALFDYLKENYIENSSLFNWTSLPTYEQLNFVLDKSWEFLKADEERLDPILSANQLCRSTNNFVRNQKTLKGIILANISEHKVNRGEIQKHLKDGNYEISKWLRGKPKSYGCMSDNELIHLSINDALKLKKNVFEYKLPKWLKTFNSIQEAVCKHFGDKAGNYLHYANIIENDFMQENLAILAEFGIPSSAISKLQKYIPDNMNEDEILGFISSRGLLNKANLINYEKVKVEENL
ncbi:DEAD/DEAH box helicase [Psychromonas hadalis]|uniref:DEAD/DEAH box helicase n=1 Tax=Psychromonas hadalis TaxID=211669 RepID=UPI0003B2FFDE|nr:DEAD/DEAH box helicase [Psychromonas hadalis]